MRKRSPALPSFEETNRGTMPPKPKSPAKGKGKGKLSKADKEKLKKEEEAQKLREEEEERARKEQEEQERLERERLEREERERILAAEHQRHVAELAQLASILDGNYTALSNLENARRAKAKWDRYMRCDGSPDPTIPAEINTYINLWKDDVDRNDIQTVLKESHMTLALINELEYLLEDTPLDQLDEATENRYRETIVELQNILHAKLDESTVLLLKNASSQADSETGNLQFIKGSESTVLMLWGNLVKNPRFKSFTFEAQDLTFELPKQLALSDVAVRVIRTCYDHFSHRCRTFRLKRVRYYPPPPEEEEVVPPEDGEKKEGEEGEKPEGEEGEEGADSESVKEEEKTDEPESPPTPVKEPEKAKTPAIEEPPEGGEEEEEEEEEEEYELEDEDTVDLRAYQVLGGVVHFDLLTLPPQPKQVKSWVMTQVTTNELKRVPYAEDSSPKLGATLSGTIAMGQTLDPKAVAANAAAAESLGAPPIGVTVKLPDNVLFSEEPQMVYWWEEGKQWRLDGFVDIKFEQESKMLSFKTIKFGPLACIQDKHINMPFQSWELFPLGLNHARFTIIAAVLEVEIEIKDHLCCFRQTGENDPKPELESISNKWMEPRRLIETMKAAGVNLFPEADSKKYVSISEKDEQTEGAAYSQMALTASHFAFSWSKWNAESTPDRIILLGSEKLEQEPVKDEDWAVLLTSKKQTMRLKMGEYDEEFSDSHAEGSQFHADLYHMVCDLSSEAGHERMRNTNYRFIDAIHTMLESTRIIAYS